MKVQIVYSSLSGCTRRLAEGIFAALPVRTSKFLIWRRANRRSTPMWCSWATGWIRAAPTPP